MLLNCGAEEESWESLGLQGDPTTPSKRKSVLNIHWRDWCWSWNSNTLATWWKTWLVWKDPDAGNDWRQEEKEDNGRAWDGWMASSTQWAWVWVNSRSWWWTGNPGMLQSMGLQSWHNWVTEPNWTLRSNLPDQSFLSFFFFSMKIIKRSGKLRDWYKELLVNGSC